jgi:hypothetical protein
VSWRFVVTILLFVIPSPALANEQEPTEADSLGGYLERLHQEALKSFSSYSLEVAAIPDTTIDSLMTVYEETGEVPDISTPIPRRFDFDPYVADLRFNRVEGLNLMAGGRFGFPTPRRTELFGAIGYGTASEETTYEFGVRADLGRRLGSAEIDVIYARDLRSYGSGNIPGKILYAVVAGEDYGDYYLHEGWSVGLERRLGPTELELRFRREDHFSMRTATDFSFFGGNDPFRPNPPVGGEDLHVLSAEVVSRRVPGVSQVRFRGELAGGGLGGDYDYESLWSEMKGSRPLWNGDRVVLRAEAGWVDRGAPRQSLHHMGGFRTLRGYEVNEFPAREYAHLAIDYEIGKNLLGFVPFLGRQRIQFVPFLDSAAIFDRQSPCPCIDTDFDETIGRYSAGLGLQKNVFGIPGGAAQLRLDVTRRLDRADDAMTYRVLFTYGR